MTEKNLYHGFEAVKSGVLQQNDNFNYQTDKMIAKDPHLTTGSRVGAVVDAVKDKGKAIGHGVQKEAHKQQAMH